MQGGVYVRKLQFCIKTPPSMRSISLAWLLMWQQGARLYYLTQSLAKCQKGLELLKLLEEASQSASGYEVVWTINAQYSILTNKNGGR